MINISLSKNQSKVVHNSLLEYISYLDKMMQQVDEYDKRYYKDAKETAQNLLGYMCELYEDEIK